MTTAFNLADLRISPGIHILKKTSNPDAYISNALAKRALKAGADGKSGKFLLFETGVAHTIAGAHRLNYSYCVFKREAPVSFIEKNLGVSETRYGYVIIADTKDFLLISKKHAADMGDQLDPISTEISYAEISSAFIDGDCLIESVSMANLDISGEAVRRKAVSAKNLQRSTSTFGLNRYSPRSVKAFKGSKRVSLTFSTGKVGHSGDRLPVSAFLDWCNERACDARAGGVVPPYLSRFSRPLDFASNIVDLTPRHILLGAADLLKDLSSLGPAYEKVDGVEQVIALEPLFAHLENAMALGDVDDNDRYPIETPPDFDSQLFLKKRTSSFALTGELLSRVYFLHGGAPKSLYSAVNEKQDFIVTFDKPSFIYNQKRLISDPGIVSDAKHLLDVVSATPAYQHTTSEKGITPWPSTGRVGTLVGPRDVNFDPSCIFFHLHGIRGHYDFYVCDDMDTEWADFIGVTLDSITLIHAKHDSSGDRHVSASKFHVVVSQALKNLQPVWDDVEVWRGRSTRWEEDYMESQIPRNLGRLDVAAGIQLFERARLSPNVNRKVVLAVDFLSKATLEDQVDRIIRDDNPQDEAVQLVWLLSSFVYTCRECGISPHIWCRP